MIYFLACALTNSVKIGTTTVDIEHRLAEIRPCSPVPLELLATAEGDYRVEDALHAEFDELRLHNEWFRLEGPLRALIRKILVDGPEIAAVLLGEIRARHARSEHGTVSKYVMGCRCRACAAARRAYGASVRRPDHVSTWKPGRRGRPPKSSQLKGR